MSKNTKRKLYKTNSSTDMEYAKIIKIAIGVIIVLALTYFVTAVASGEIKFGKSKKEEKQELSIQYEEIIAGQILNRSPKEYYVLLFDFTDTYASYFLAQKDDYLSLEDAIPFYIVDLEKHSNKQLVAEKEEQVKTNVNNIDELKVMSPTILKVRGHSVVESIRGNENILKFFKENN